MKPIDNPIPSQRFHLAKRVRSRTKHYHSAFPLLGD